MKLIANLKLCPTSAHSTALRQTLKTANAACHWLSGQAWANKTFGQFALHRLAYSTCRTTFGLSAQMVVRCIAKVADAYKLDRKTRRRFRRTAAQPYDDRIFRFCSDTTVSLWTLSGRLTIFRDCVGGGALRPFPYQCGPRQRALLAYRKGEVDLMLVKGVFYLAVVCDVPDPEARDIAQVLGIDLGIVNLAVDSDGTVYTGAAVEQARQWYATRRTVLQHHGTRSAHRRLRQLKGRQARFQKDINHCIAKRIVQTAQRSAAAIALEDLRGIRQRVKARRSQRARHANWGFSQLRQLIGYKAQRVGLPVWLVDAKHTSQECPQCHHVARANRKSQAAFSCLQCRFAAPADVVAARNIRSRAVVNLPTVAQPRQLRLALA